MARFALSLLVLLINLSVYAVDEPELNKINPQGLSLLNKYERQLHGKKQGRSTSEIPEYVSVLINLNKGYTAADLQAIPGVNVINPDKKILLVELPLNELRKIAGNPAVKRISLGGKAKSLMNNARPASQVTEVQNGLQYNLPLNYSGEGVLLGMMDEGLDPNHINFYNQELTQSRVKQLWIFPSENPNDIETYSTQREIANFTTDNADAYHGTHVAGIMGGAYNGKGTVAMDPDAVNTQVYLEETSVPFYGVAPNANLALGAGELYFQNIAYALDNFAYYCSQQGKPGAFNLSLGVNSGPLDGTSDVCQFLNQYTDDVAIVIAAGNEGSSPICVGKTFESDPQPLKTIIYNGTDYYSGYIDLWSKNSEPVTTSFGIINVQSGELIFSYPVSGIDRFVSIYGYEEDEYSSDATNVLSKEFAQTFLPGSYVDIYTAIDPNNNRFNAYLDIELELKSEDSNFLPVMIVSGNPGVSFNANAQGEFYFTNGRLKGWTSGNSDMSINDLACAEGVIAVGSYVSKNHWPTLSKFQLGYQGIEELTVSYFSSYGQLIDGRKLPNFCAPGQAIISSISTYWMDNYGSDTYYSDGDKSIDNYGSTTAKIDRNNLNNFAKANRTDYWISSQGTSMAAPYVTGVAALLLQQDPTLTSTEIRKLLEETAVFPTDQKLTSAETIQWGAGRINVLKAMQTLIGDLSAIGDVRADTSDKLSIDMTDTELTAYLAGERGLVAHLYSMAGHDVAVGNCTGESVTLNISRLPKGIYILSVLSADGAKINRRVLIGQ